MEHLLVRLYNALMAAFKTIEENREAPLGYFKKMVYSHFIDIIKYGEKNDDEFAKQLGMVHKKYGVEIFRDSLIPYVCIVNIHKYLTEHGYPVQKPMVSILTDEEIRKDYENVISLKDFCGNDVIVGRNELNQCEKIITTIKLTESYIIDTENTLWVFGSHRCPFPEKLYSDVSQVITGLCVLVGIDTDSKLWQEKMSEVFPSEKMYFEEVEDVKFKKITRFVDSHKNEGFFAISEKGRIYQFVETAIVGTGIFTIKEHVSNASAKDISSYGGTMAFVSTTGNVYGTGYLNKISLANSGFKKHMVEIEFDGHAEKVFVFKNMIFIIDALGKTWSMGMNEFGCLGTSSNKSLKFKKLKISEKVIDISYGDEHILFLTNTGKIYGCGRNLNGELGSFEKLTLEPKLLTDIVGKSITAGNQCTFIVDYFANVFAMGTTKSGRLGFIPTKSDVDRYETPVAINLLDYIM